MHISLKTGLLAIALAYSAQANTVVTLASFPDHDRTSKVGLAAFKKLHPEIEVKVVSLAYPDHHNAMTTALATGSNLPDVMAIDFDFIGKFSESGGLEDLAKAPYNGLQNKNLISRFSLPQGISDGGVLAAVPSDIGPGALFYRKDLIEKAGVTETDLTKSWESYIAAGKKVKAATGAYMLANAVDLKDIIIRANLKDGEGMYFDNAGNVLVDNARFVKAFEVAKAARVAGIDGKIGAWSNEWSEGFKRNQIVSQMMGAWLAGHLKNWLAPSQKGLWRSAQLPNGAYASWGGSFYAIPKKTANKEAAWELIKFLTLNKEQQIAAFREVDAFPSLIEAQNDSFVDEPIEYLGGQKARQLWRVAAGKIPSASVDKFDNVAKEIINAELEKVLEQNKDIKTALADAKAAIKRRVRR
ncbi:ABC transporter substrate-binding protein [Chitinimonas naiadis]